MSLYPILNVSVQPSKLQFAVTKVKYCHVISVSFIYMSLFCRIHLQIKKDHNKLQSSIQGQKMLSYDTQYHSKSCHYYPVTKVEVFRSECNKIITKAK